MSAINLDFRSRVVARAADYFDDISKRRTPNLPDEWAAEMMAVGCAGLVGAPVPEPLPALGPVMPAGRGHIPGGAKDLRKLVPQAKTMLLSQGYQKSVSDGTAMVYAAFLTNPQVEMKVADVAEMTGVEPMNTSSKCQVMAKKGLLAATRRAHYKLAGPLAS